MHSIQDVDGKTAMFLRPGDDRVDGGEGNRVKMWYKSIGFLLGNLASRWQRMEQVNDLHGGRAASANVVRNHDDSLPMRILNAPGANYCLIG